MARFLATLSVIRSAVVPEMLHEFLALSEFQEIPSQNNNKIHEQSTYWTKILSQTDEIAPLELIPLARDGHEWSG